jgi:hypothetical protein
VYFCQLERVVRKGVTQRVVKRPYEREKLGELTEMK